MACTEAVGKPASNQLKTCVTEQKSAEHPAKMHIINAKLAANGRPGNRNIRPVKKCNSAQYKEPKDKNNPYGDFAKHRYAFLSFTAFQTFLLLRQSTQPAQSPHTWSAPYNRAAAPA